MWDLGKISILVHPTDNVRAEHMVSKQQSVLCAGINFICISGLQRTECTSILTPKFNIISFVSKWWLDINPVLATLAALPLARRMNACDRHISCGICIHRWDAMSGHFPPPPPSNSTPSCSYCSCFVVRCVHCAVCTTFHSPWVNALTHTRIVQRTQCYLSIQLMPFCISA